VGGQEDIEHALVENMIDRLEITVGVRVGGWAGMNLPGPAAEAAKAGGTRIEHLDPVPGRPQDAQEFPRRKTRSLREKNFHGHANPERHNKETTAAL
jgi:hypothetical protein